MDFPITRRQMLAASATLLSSSFVDQKRNTGDGYAYYPANVTGASAELPSDKCIPFDWQFGEIAPGNDGVKLAWEEPFLEENSQLRLRITSATDVREIVVLEARTAVTDQKIADWDIRFAALLQPFELHIPGEAVQAVLIEGITLRMVQGTKPFWFFRSGNASKTAPTAYLPHLLAHGGSMAPNAWKDRLVSMGSMQTFGWQQGIVWDGLLELSKHSSRAKQVLDHQLDLFFAQGSLSYCNLNNIKTGETIHTVESILPFAILAQTDADHPLLQTAVAFCERHANAAGVIADGDGSNRAIKTEECYTVSYPLAVLAKILNRPELTKLGIQTLLARVKLLEKENSIYQRGSEKGELYFENWSRGVAWYLLGLAKTLVHLPESADKEVIKMTFKNAVAKVISYQQPDGLWFCFFHRPETGLETSGTAGIAAALTYGYQHGLLDRHAKAAALKSWTGLVPYLTPDGFLTGTAQVNKGGNTLQENGFRVISPYTLGFFAHLTKYEK